MVGTVVPLNQQFPERRPDQVTTHDTLSTASIGWRSNPDTLVGRHGLAIYSRMANDEQVKAVLNFKRDAITARGWQFTFDESSGLSEEDKQARSRVFYAIINRMRGSFADALNVIMTGRAYGFSVTEKVYAAITVDGKEWPGINRLLGRDPLSFRFYTDEYGVLQRIEQQTHRAGLVEVDPARVIHYVHAPEWDHVYGRSDLREAYRSWYIKEQISGLWPLYLERFAGGFIHASQTADTTLTTAEQESLDRVLANAKSIGAIRTPPGISLSVLFPSSTDAYERAIQFHDLAIAKALLVPNLLGISHTGQTGAYSQSQTQLEAFFWTLNADATRLEQCLNEQLFRDLGDQCWGDGEYPEFKFKPASVEHARWVVNTWKELVQAKAVQTTIEDEAYLRSLLEMPAREMAEEETIEDAPVASDPASAFTGVQITAMLDVLQRVTDGTLPKESAVLVLVESFPISEQTARALVAPIKEGSTPPPVAPAAAPPPTGGTPPATPPPGGEDDEEDDAEDDEDEPDTEDMAARRGEATQSGTYIAFDSTDARDAWLATLRAGDVMVVDEPVHMIGVSPPTGPNATLVIKSSKPISRVPRYASLTIEVVDGARVEARYAPAH